MEVVSFSGALAAATHDLVAVAVFQGESRRPSEVQLDRALSGALTQAAHDEHFEGKDKQLLVVHTLGKLRPRRLAFVGLGKRAALTPAALTVLGSRIARLGREVGARDALLVLPEDVLSPATAAAVARGASAGAYVFDRYKSDKGKKRPLERLALHVPDRKVRARVQAAVGRAAIVSEATALARDLVNEPPIELYPEVLAARARAVARKAGLGCKILGPAELARLGMRLLLGVGAGSSHPPRLVHLTYTPPGAKPRRRRSARGLAHGAAHGPLVLVGKGITFDSGGLSLKPAASMEDMKSDMAGAAAVLAAMQAVAALQPTAEVHGLLALAENMPSGTAIRPGDVITSAAGKTIEITNTDAEGRLVLADALHYACKLEPVAVIDVATLTGAIVIALGHGVAGLFSNDDHLAGQVLAAGAASGEHFWRMPLVEEQRRELRSEVADLKNTGSREGAAINAALFLSEFVGSTPWVHLDIAGLALGKGRGEPKGATGFAVPTLVALAAPGVDGGAA